MIKTMGQGLGCTLALVCLIAVTATAQTQSDSATPPQPTVSDQKSQPNGSTAGGDDTAAAPLLYVPTLDQPGIKELGGGGNWFSDTSRLFSWGPIQVRSADFLYGYISGNVAGGSPESVSAGILQTNIAYVKRLKRSLLVWQYNPRLLYNDGQVSLAAANQDTSLNTLFAPAPHVTVGISEGFTFYGPLNTFNDKTFGASTDSAIGNSFLTPLFNTQQQTWLDTLSVPVTYSPTARTSVQVSGLFNYVRTTDGSESSGGVVSTGSAVSMYDYGSKIDVSHSLSSNQTIGIYYSYQITRTSDIEGTATINSFGGSTSRRLGQGLTLTAEGGASHSSGVLFTGWTAVGSASVTKTFQHGSFDANYGRDSTFTGLIGSYYENRAWADYNRQISRRTKWSAGGGYLSSSVLGQEASGKYVSTRLDYGLSPTIGWFFTYVHVWEIGVGPQLVNGGQSQFQMGLRWTPRLRPGS